MPNGPRTLADLGETAFLRALRGKLSAGDGVVLGPGDDAAVVRTGEATLASADMLIEDVHFKREFCSAADIGYKSLAVNASDIAAMGGRPRYALLCLGAPANTEIETLNELIAGLNEAAEDFGMSVVGGDLSSAPQLTISVTVLGHPSSRIVRRSGAKAGDLVCVTGAVGGSAAGLALLKLQSYDVQANAIADRHPDLLRAYRRPAPRISAGAALADSAVHAMIDVSDGLARDAGHLATESGLGVLIRSRDIPLAPGVGETAKLLEASAPVLAAGGGEDYELCLACAPEDLLALERAIAPLPITVVGTFTADETERILDLDGSSMPLDGIGWEHFS